MDGFVKVKFTKSPTGRFGMAYNAGHTGFVKPEIAKKLVEEGYAVILENPTKKVEEKTSYQAEAVIETAKKRTGKK